LRRVPLPAAMMATAKPDVSMGVIFSWLRAMKRVGSFAAQEHNRSTRFSHGD
jgi:hypothetical protein